MTTNLESPAQSPGSDIVSRREAIAAAAGRSSGFLTALGIGAVPVALAAMSRTASAQTTADLNDALQFILLITQLQAELHSRAATASGLIPAADASAMAGMRVQDSSQVQSVGALITAAGFIPNDKPNFDFTAKGAFPSFNFLAGQYATYQIIAQGLEDLGVRAFKGQIARMKANGNTMVQAATLGAIQARHSAEMRRIRGLKGWITANSRDDLPAIFQPAYDGEEATIHAGFDSSALGAANGGATAVTQAFDEPLTKDQASVIVSQFLA